MIHTYRNTHLFRTECLAWGGWTTPGGRAVVVDTDVAKVGVIICHRGDFPELAFDMALLGAGVIVRPSAFLRSNSIWELTTCACACDNHVCMVSVNAVGRDAGDNYYFGNIIMIYPIAWKLAQARGTEEIMYARLSSDPIHYVTHGTVHSIHMLFPGQFYGYYTVVLRKLPVR